MFGITRRTKAVIEDELKRAKIELAEAQSMQKSLIAEKVYWQNHAMEVANQVAKWMDLHREILRQLASEEANASLRAYAQSIEQAIIEHRPSPAMIAGALASAGKDVQGVFTAVPTPRPQVTAGVIPQNSVEEYLLGEAR